MGSDVKVEEECAVAWLAKESDDRVVDRGREARGDW